MLLDDLVHAVERQTEQMEELNARLERVEDQREIYR